ncbi:hypothetical protein M9H77_18393 [Catharanthus roseus]|uniref:Uncharacterized protein n=1 Tax=Catharanthus roseus TaxID=4058 RepID=A0ACC0B7C0_CATRO|nr:hypothetical protein M9H77_18393 [Catharanthus roseus]
MEEVPAHVHPGPIVTDVLSRQHEHRSGLIWSGDRETCYTDLQCRRFGHNLFQCYSAAPRRLPLFRLQSEEGTIGSMDSESVHRFRDRRRSNHARPWIYFLTYWRTHASRLLREFGSRALPQLVRGF